MTTYSDLYYHLIWSTKNREPFINEIIENTLHQYIAEIIHAKGGSLIQIGIMPDQLHILLRTGPAIPLSDLVKDIKVNSTQWIKNTGKVYQHFSWQEGFEIFSFSKSYIDAVQSYILNQKKASQNAHV
jgi:putative transposase